MSGWMDMGVGGWNSENNAALSLPWKIFYLCPDEEIGARVIFVCTIITLPRPLVLFF